MDVRANKNRLIETMRIERARWDMLLVQVDSRRLTLPGVAGRLSVRDILDDLVRHERWVANQLVRTVPGELAETPAPAYEPEQQSPTLSVSDLMAESRRAFEQIVTILMRLPAEDIFSPQRYEWTGGTAVGAVVPGHTLDQYRRYDGAIRLWMSQTKKRRNHQRSTS